MSAPKKVLLVEDEFILYDELVEFFESNGYEIAGHEERNKPVANYNDAIEILHKQNPDLAVLDIKIDGKKDGLEVGDYIRTHYNIPIIFLTANDNHQNMDRAIELAADGYVIKHDKPLDKRQLWADVRRLKDKIEQSHKHRTEGRFMKVKEIDLSQLEKKINTAYTQPEDPVELKTFIKWDEIKMIASSNKITKNTILLYSKYPNKGFFYRGTLDEAQTLLPDYFIRFSSSVIVNAHSITAEGKPFETYYLQELRAEIGVTYKAEAISKLKLYLGNKF